MAPRTNDPRTLPLWAQVELTRLKLDLEHKDNQLANAVGLVPSAIEVDPHRQYHEEKTRIYLHERAVVRYTIPGGHIDIRWDRDELYVVAETSSRAAGQMFVIVPGANNVVHLRFTELPVME